MYTADELEIRCALAGSPRAEQLIACLEGEIAKRDEELAACRVAVENCEVFRARIVELESRYQRDVWGLNNEGDPIGGDPAGGYANDNARLRAELAELKAQEPVAWAGVIEDCASLFVTKPQLWKAIPLYAAPVSEAKAQGVVQWPNADEIMQMAFEEGQPADDASGYYFELEEFDLFIERLMSEVARLNAAPVQQVSVPDGYVLVPKNSTLAMRIVGARDCSALIQPDQAEEVWHAMLGAVLVPAEYAFPAPAAPAADAGLVEALEMALDIGDGCSRGFLGKFQAKARAALAAHRSTGVA